MAETCRQCEGTVLRAGHGSYSQHTVVARPLASQAPSAAQGLARQEPGGQTNLPNRAKHYHCGRGAPHLQGPGGGVGRVPQVRAQERDAVEAARGEKRSASKHPEEADCSDHILPVPTSATRCQQILEGGTAGNTTTPKPCVYPPGHPSRLLLGLEQRILFCQQALGPPCRLPQLGFATAPLHAPQHWYPRLLVEIFRNFAFRRAGSGARGSPPCWGPAWTWAGTVLSLRPAVGLLNSHCCHRRAALACPPPRAMTVPRAAAPPLAQEL